MRFWHTAAALTWLQTILKERFGHTFDLLPQPEANHIALCVPGDARCIQLALDGSTFTRTDSSLGCARWNALDEGWDTALPGSLPAPGGHDLCAPLITATESGWHIGYDILGLTYWMLTRQEEVGRTDLDNHARFPATASHGYMHNYLERPIVDEWLHVLGQVIGRTWPGIRLTRHRFEVKVSHDVDSPSLYAFKPWRLVARMMAGHILKRRDLGAFCTAALVKQMTKGTLHPADPHNTFEWLMDVSEANNLTSAFYFICGRTSDMDADYEPGHPIIRALMRRIHERGHEIGLHPSYGTYQRPALVAQEAERLKAILAEENIQQSAIGGRMHYLRWEQPTTLQAWNDAGLAYDSTLGYADRPGFRCGTCFEYPAFNPASLQPMSLRIRPLVVMECTIIGGVYSEAISLGSAESKILELKGKCRALGGCFTLLWHNSFFTGGVSLKKVYERLIEDKS
ncbi:hypothetical protein CXP40_12695 [Pseudomonas sp. YY-1]|uniref:polysaccharide deacetylase family protein n=1 Tax=Pseudomonas sp. YY-1 TaxID=2058659 RepID=UPI000CB74192|nr:polysaccharide deacetylase family protein [Pseudomonas sp. YY-1]PKQ41251.1 hypothetical protein CXP40_12695 [Pseudomonas sp. YY-1]